MFRKLSLILMLVLAGIGSKTFAQTTVVIGDNAGEYQSFYHALQAIHGMTNPGQVTILLTKDTQEQELELSLSAGDDIVLKNDSGASHSMNFSVYSSRCGISVPDNSTLTIGGGDNPIIIRASKNTNNGAEFFVNYTGVLIKVAGGTLNIYDNVELCYGENVIWMKKVGSSSPVVNMHGGVIHSATKICVNIADGTFNMDGGYICGHYFTGGDVVPDLTRNPLLDYSKLRHHFGHDSQDGCIPKNGILNYLTSEDAYHTAEYNLHRAMGVLVEKNSGTEAAPSTKFDMSGGVICGIYGDYTTFNANDNNGRFLHALAVYVDKSEFDFSGGRIYACCAGTDGPGIRLTNSDFQASQAENFDLGHVNMSGTASVSYCQSAKNGGGVRVEQGVTFRMSGGEISHCVTSATDYVNNGGGGGVRMVSSKFVMSGDAEICYNYSTGKVEAYNGGGIAAVWQESFGSFHTKLELNGGKIHHNHADSYGGGVVATDKGQGGETSGIDVIFNGVQIYENTSETHGGGVYVGGSADFEINENTKIYNNTTKGSGGGMYVSSIGSTGGHIGGVSASACEIYNNHAVNGGGIYADNAYVDIHEGAQVYGHEITGNGGGVCVMSGASYTQDGGNIGIEGNPNKATNGGGVYVGGSGSVIIGDTGSIKYNEASSKGGGAFLEGGSITMTNGSIDENKAASDGGGFYVSGGDATISGGNIKNNIATSGNGGGFYSAGGTVNISNATISGNHADNGFGGGLYSAAAITVGGETEGSGATISGNEAKNGGGFYVAGADDATTTIQSGSIVSGNIATVNGAGAYIESGNLTVKTSDINGNKAENGNGGGFYVQGGLSTISGGTVQYNIATNGAGLYMEGTSSSSLATATFSNGTFQYNEASGNGGGIYLASNSALTMSGTSHIVDNHVSNVSGHGGGVMVNGGQFIIIGGTGSSFNVNGNYVDESTNSNNVYLNGANDYITIDKDHGTPTGITVGISISGNDIPKKVVYCENAVILNEISDMIKQALSSGTDNSIFDDAHRYEPLISDDYPFEKNYLFFVKVWPVEVTEQDLTNLADMEGIKYIDTPNKLAAFMMLANGYREGFDGGNMKGVITADLEMGGSLWIPIGGAKDASGNSIPFTGSLDGGGHVISNLISVGLMNYNDYGLFGKTDGAKIKNIVVENCNFVSGEARRMGALICDMKGGTVENCIASGKVIASGSETYSYQVENPETGEMLDYYDPLYCVVGGLIGEASDDAQIINCMSTVEVEALPKEDESMYPRSQKITVGGLVGMTSSGTVIRNSYAHSKISHKCETRTGIAGSGYNDPTPLGRYVGGLVGINNGEITNCYVRFQEGTQLALGEDTNNSSQFGMFAGNNAGTISYCYAPDNTLFSTSRSYVHTQADSPSTLNNYGDFNTTVTPYMYKHNDNLVTLNGASETSVLDKLNEWVDNQSTSKDAPAISYSRWMRTCASPINGDYPVLEYDNLEGTLGYTTIASRDGINMEYNKSLDDMLDKYDATGNALFVYNTPSEEIETSSDMPLYIDENVALKLAEGVSITNAYVGITLDNSQSKTVGTETANQFNWHMFATPLANAPLGVNYEGNTTTYNYWNGQTLPQFNFYTESDYDGYFPSKDFGGNNYYTDWDYYCYSEPDYQWINFKRNSASHFHQDTENPLHPNHAPITYTNEDKLGVGKGYLLATKEETFLQSHGTLNNGDVEITLSKTDDVQPYFQGYNLIGNPYQAYLNFSETGLGSYVILDEDAGGYVAYTNGASKNAYPAASPTKDGGEVPAPGQFLHMHQGFFVVAASDGQEVTLRPDMCVTNASSTFRGEEQPAYPLVNLAVTEADGSREFVTIELDRPDNGGAAKMKGLRNGTGLIYTSIDGEDYSIAFMPAGTTSAAVRFETLEEGTFTMNWNTQNGTFSYLHLIDNMTGMDIDCLASDEYKFTASPDDYASRFKLVFSYTGVEENESASTSSASFAFMMNGNLVVNGEGMADIFDLTGRLVSSTRLVGVQSTISLPSMAQGIYTIRLTNGNGSKVQKVVIK